MVCFIINKKFIYFYCFLGDVYERWIWMRIWKKDDRDERSSLENERGLFILSRNGEV